MDNGQRIVTVGSYTNFDNPNVHRLSELKPAATKLILEPGVDLVELLKLTLFDLTLKQVLIIKKVLRKAHSRDPHLREYVVVETGKNFSKYSPNAFEEYFTSIIDEDSYYQLKSYLREIAKEVPPKFRYKQQIIQDAKIKDLFKRDLISSLFPWIRTNARGEQLRADISSYLNEADLHIGDLIDSDPDKALELILFLQGNIFLLKNLKFEHLENLKAVSIEGRSGDDGYFDDWFWIDFLCDTDLSISELFSDVSEMFDSIDDYFDFSAGDWDGDFGVDFD